MVQIMVQIRGQINWRDLGDNIMSYTPSNSLKFTVLFDTRHILLP